jgi:hypothetical protein
MNERIKELAEQAGFTEGGYESDDGPWIGPEFDKEKFAELLVADVLNEVLKAMDEGMDVYYTVEEIFRVEV